MKHIKLFESKAIYDSYINGNPDLPNVSYIIDINGVFYNPYISSLHKPDLVCVYNITSA
jgi:hypothetical protein